MIALNALFPPPIDFDELLLVERVGLGSIRLIVAADTEHLSVHLCGA